MTEQAVGQVSLFDQDTWCGKTCQESSPQTKAKTSAASSKRQRGSSKKMPQFLDLTASGVQADASWETGGALLGEYTMHSFGVSPSEENASRLSQILEETPHPKYCLSERACQGILRRAEKKGKQLPEMLKNALIRQATPSKFGGGVEVDGNGKKAGKGPLVQTELSGTLGVSQDQTLFCLNNQHCKTYQKVTGTVDAGISKGTSNQLASNDMFIANASVVRRLTPLECERLQGFPDGWTDIGEWIDSKGEKHKPADTPRYKALGNSIALPFWFWLLRRISAQYERPATLGSLFDGIGGFPLCWERCNGKGTAIWASEIEEFPMAVTKARFGE